MQNFCQCAGEAVRAILYKYFICRTYATPDLRRLSYFSEMGKNLRDIPALRRIPVMQNRYEPVAVIPNM